eukprot:884573_1
MAATPRRNQRLRNKSTPPQEQLIVPKNDICHKCSDWTKPVGAMHNPGAVCEDCPHAYHDACIPTQFRNKSFDTCSDLGFECDVKTAPIHFELPDKKNYPFFKYCDIQYNIGDDVVVECLNENGAKTHEVARIKEIYSENDDRMVKMWLIWFWKATEAACRQKGIQYDPDHNKHEDDVRMHELYIDESYSQPICVDALVSNHSSSKALVVSSSEEYLKRTQSMMDIDDDDAYYETYWCTHSYNHDTHKKEALPYGAISEHRTVAITPCNKKHKRKRNYQTRIEMALSDASKALMLSTVPETLPCREEEHKEITEFLKQQIMSSGQGSGLYISGMPGTGKTATVRQITNELQKLTVDQTRGRGRRKKKNKEALNPFEFHEINAMKLPTPRHIYTELAKKLMGKHFAPNTAVRKLRDYFSTQDDDRKICVLLVDELDFLLTRQQRVIYNLFDWPTHPHAKLIVIGIANTMDLPERLLPRVSSRLGTTRVVFKSYQRRQLTQIIEQRLESTKVFALDAIRFCASAVAGVSGDCRTALQICRRAVEIAQKDITENGVKHVQRKRKRARKNGNNGRIKEELEDREEIVSLQHLKSAKEAFDETNDIQIVSMCSIYEKLFLTAIVMCNMRSNGFAASTDKYRHKFDNLVHTQLGAEKMTTVHFRNMVHRLEDVGIIAITVDRSEWTEFIAFKIKLDEAMHALKENDVCARILSTLHQSI